MSEFIVILAIIFILTIGYTVIKGFNLLPQNDNLSALAYSYGMGVGLIAMQLYVYSRLNISWHLSLLSSPWVMLFLYILFKKRKTINFDFFKIPKLRTIDKLLIVGIIISVAYVIFEALIRPVVVWDAWAIWLLKSKIFFIDGRINSEMLNYVMSDYPLLVSLLGTFVYIVLGQVNDTAVLLTSVTFYIFLGLSIFAALKKKFGVTYALLFTFLFATIQNFIRHGGRFEAGQADLPLGYFIFISSLLLIEYLKKSNSKILLLLSVFLGFTTLIKFEGIPISFIIVGFIIYHIFKNKLFNQLFFLLFWFIPLVDWQIYKNIYNLSHTYFSGHTLIFSLDKMINAFVGTFKEMVNVKSWSLLWITYFYTFIVFLSKQSKEQLILNCIILSQLSIYISIYIFTFGNDPHSSVERLLIHIAPLVVYYVAISAHLIFFRDGKLWVINKSSLLKSFFHKFV